MLVPVHHRGKERSFAPGGPRWAHFPSIPELSVRESAGQALLWLPRPYGPGLLLRQLQCRHGTREAVTWGTARQCVFRG